MYTKAISVDDWLYDDLPVTVLKLIFQMIVLLITFAVAAYFVGGYRCIDRCPVERVAINSDQYIWGFRPP